MPDPNNRQSQKGYLPALPATSESGRSRAGIPIAAIGASAGGLKAFMEFLEAIPENSGMAFVLIQHLAPDSKSLMAEILGARTHMKVRQIENGDLVERDCVYVNPPGHDVSLSRDTLSLRAYPPGARTSLPFDFFLHSLAVERGARAMCVILSGTGNDGSKGLKTIKQSGGFVIAQSPEDASEDGMPRSAILTGDVDAVLEAAQAPAALLNWNTLASHLHSGAIEPGTSSVPDWLAQVLEIILERTGADFRLYKPGTLIRRITRRMAMATPSNTQSTDYRKLLLSSPEECEALAADLLINVTRFFRDPQVFEFLESDVIPDLIRNNRLDRPVRVWIAGCSSGEEVWSIAMLLREAIDEDGRGVRLQILASDIDPDAVATARAGIYPASIASDISAPRLARFFVADDRGYRVRDDLRAQAVFSVQNLLSDPPFARLDMISCRNVLIYLGPEAQSKIISLFHFALLESGILLLGTSETAGDVAGRFDVVSKAARIYRHRGRIRPANPSPVGELFEGEISVKRFLQDVEPLPDHRFADVSRRAVAHFYTPASVLVTRTGECLYFLGPIEQYLEVLAGSATLDILPMVPLSHRAALRAAMASAGPDLPLIQAPGTKTTLHGETANFMTDIRYIADEGDDLILITFRPAQGSDDFAADRAVQETDQQTAIRLVEVSGLSLELDHTTRLLERALETEQKIRRDSLRLNEEYQSTNEELVTSKEELQSLNEELTVLNSQLQEALERQRTTSDDLKNVLYSTHVATLFLDTDLQIRFFTPATKSVFGVIASDIGRPLADLRSLAIDPSLIDEARAVLTTAEIVEREISTPSGAWFLRRILPYRSHSDTIEGVVITYVDVLERHNAMEALKSAIRQAELAMIAKTRFLATASHDLRQPLQTLTFIHSLLGRDAAGAELPAESQQLIDRMEHAIGAMSGMLNTMLDINQIEAGIISYELEDIPVAEMLADLYAEYQYHAEAKTIQLRLVPSSAVIRSDRRLLQQMIRNLLSNAIRYTDLGCVLIGCRRRGTSLRIEIWDTGIGISEDELPTVFGEYHKINTRGRNPSEGMGLGLSIVQRLADLLGHRIHARSAPERGSMFSIEVPMSMPQPSETHLPQSNDKRTAPSPNPGKAAKILIAEDDPDLRELLSFMLEKSGHSVVAAPSLETALAAAGQHGEAPDLLIADYNLPNGQNGLDLARSLNRTIAPDMRVIILTGDISVKTEGLILENGFRKLIKPVSQEDLETEIQIALSGAVTRPEPDKRQRTANAAAPQVIIVDDDDVFSETVASLLRADNLRVAGFPSGESFLAKLIDLTAHGEPVCVLLDAYLGGISGFDVLEALSRSESPVRTIMITGQSDVAMAVRAMKAGALDFIEKPVDAQSLRLAIDRALETGRDGVAKAALKTEALQKLEKLTAREREVLERILLGDPNKNIAADLGISQRTVESHRASVMRKTGCKTLPALVRLSVRAS